MAGALQSRARVCDVGNQPNLQVLAVLLLIPTAPAVCVACSLFCGTACMRAATFLQPLA